MNTNNANILLCLVNTKLRDKYTSLDELCDDLDLNKDEIIDKLKSIGYTYNNELNQFK